MQFTDYEKQLEDYKKQLEEVYACLETEYTENLPAEQLVVLNQLNIHYARVGEIFITLKSIYDKEFIILKSKFRDEATGKPSETSLEEKALLHNNCFLIDLQNFTKKIEQLLKALSKAIDSGRTIISFAKTELHNSNI